MVPDIHLRTISQEMQEGTPDSKVHGANMGPIWGRQDPGGPHVGPKNFARVRSLRLELHLRSQWVWPSAQYGCLESVITK